MSSSNIKEGMLVRMLRFLDAKQLAGFEAYLACSLFNTNARLAEVYQAIREKALDAPEKPLSPLALLEGTGINPSLYAKYTSQLVALLERFIPFWEQKDDPRHGYADAFSAWERMGLDQDLLERQYRKMKRKAEKLPPSEWQFFHAFELEHRYLHHKAGQPRKDQAPLFEASNLALDQLIAISKLRYHCASISLNRSLPLALGAAPLDFTEEQRARLPLLGKAYLQAAQLLEAAAPTAEQARQFYQWLKRYQAEFSPADQEDLFGFLLNICIPNANREGAFAKLLDEVYMEMVAGRLLGNQRRLPGSHFKNMVSIKIKLGRLQDAAEFIDRQGNELGQGDREILVPYTKGLVAYHSREFREAVSLFREVLDHQLADVHWGLEARLMLWRSYYEILELLDSEEYAEFIRQYDALRVYVSRRNRLSPDKKASYEHFIRIFNRLARMKEEGSAAEELKALKEEVLGLQVIKQRAWLCEMIDRQLAEIA